MNIWIYKAFDYKIIDFLELNLANCDEIFAPIECVTHLKVEKQKLQIQLQKKKKLFGQCSCFPMNWIVHFGIVFCNVQKVGIWCLCKHRQSIIL